MTATVIAPTWHLDNGFGALRMALERAAPPRRFSAPKAPVEPTVQALRDRDPETWSAFVREHAPAIHRYMLGRLGTQVDSEDATSEVMEEAWRNARALQDRGVPPRAWLFGIAANVVMRHRRRRFRRPPPLSLEAFDGSGGDPASSPETLDLVRAIGALPRNYADVISLRFVHGLSLQETAVALHASIDAVKGRQARALAELRHLLKHY